MVLLLSSSSCDLLKSLSQLLLLHVGYSYPNVLGHCFSQFHTFHAMTAWLLLLYVVVEHSVSVESSRMLHWYCRSDQAASHWCVYWTVGVRLLPNDRCVGCYLLEWIYFPITFGEKRGENQDKELHFCRVRKERIVLQNYQGPYKSIQ